MNSNRTIWVGTIPSGGWHVGHEKTYWVRPQGTDLTITGRAGDALLKTQIPCCYPTGFQIVGLIFDEPGCWEVEAHAGDQQLRFVNEVTARD